ncbi:hypothetical protein [Ruminococcus albus]|uniref:Conserved domain protein n=1 Tax=Ruminococcus albus 8 TaxID=246199 RepID=E9S893_RUMAL|nr:hypothetical protein [Ruminococcus albus]EGC04502.1 conserved domain protein [Ruminococcus albus 8]MCC3352254.1 hypothetical protein [Ruminococcus albus 8]
MENQPTIDRALYKIKSMDRATMDNFVKNVYQQGYNDAQAQSIDYDNLKADLACIKGIGESRLQKIILKSTE